jgi:hypothetical protein
MSPVHVQPSEAVQVHLDVNSKKSIACHFGTFPLADEGFTEPIEDLKKSLKEHNLAATDFVVLWNGEDIILS